MDRIVYAMRKLKTLMLLSIICFASGMESQVDPFNQAVLEINEKNYDQAIKRLVALTEGDKLESLEAYYNLGYAYFQQGKIAESILSLERGLQINPGDPNCITLLSIVKTKVVVQVTEIPDFILWQWYQSLVKILSTDAWAIGQLFFIVCFLMLLFFVLLKKRNELWLKSLLAVSLLLGLLCMHLSSARLTLQTNSSQAIFMEEEGYINEGADERSPAVAMISAGVKLYIVDEVGEWFKVQLDDKDVGWVQKEKVDII